MEDDLKNAKQEYLINHWSDLIEIWKSGLGDQVEFYGKII